MTSALLYDTVVISSITQYISISSKLCFTPNSSWIIEYNCARACWRADVRTYGRAGVRACGGVGVRACGRAGVRACGRAGVRACGRAGVRACGRACARLGM